MQSGKSFFGEDHGQKIEFANSLKLSHTTSFYFYNIKPNYMLTFIQQFATQKKSYAIFNISQCMKKFYFSK
jgi:hypothetical protein